MRYLKYIYIYQIYSKLIPRYRERSLLQILYLTTVYNAVSLNLLLLQACPWKSIPWIRELLPPLGMNAILTYQTPWVSASCTKAFQLRWYKPAGAGDLKGSNEFITHIRWPSFRRVEKVAQSISSSPKVFSQKKDSSQSEVSILTAQTLVSILVF